MWEVGYKCETDVQYGHLFFYKKHFEYNNKINQLYNIIKLKICF